MEEIQIHPTEMSQGENGSDKEAFERASTIVQKIGEYAKNTESFFSSACMYRVPKELRTLKESAYTPRLIAIGPLHREDKHLQTPFQHVKMSYMNNLLSRLTAGMDGLELAKQTKITVVHKCLAELKTSIDDAKKCYPEEVILDEEMMLVDGCFILEFLYRNRHDPLPVQKPDVIFGNSLTFLDVQNDLVLLENQIPFFVLGKLFQLIVDQIPNHFGNDRSLSDYVRWCYLERICPLRHYNKKKKVLMPSDCVIRVFGSGSTTTAAAEEEAAVQNDNIDDHPTAKYYHILHNLHDVYLPPHDQTKHIRFDFRYMPSASELVYAGVEFVPDAGKDLFKFKFSEPKGLFWWCRRARFEIPPLPIYASTESYLRNLIALEQACPSVSEHVSSYAILMGMLVNSDTDFRLLEKAGVVRNYLGPTEEATYLFKNLSKETFVTEHFFADACMKATEYRKRFWPKHLARLRRAYIANPGPWQCVALWVSFIALVVSFLQFFTDFIKNGECGCQGTKRLG